ncbi:MAG: xylulokinase [Bacteroidetes bacterium SB0662_bin_6]|nr:xylulokinase [Bacteroidetes bacterium SB0668_bin_1]MYE03367.1 xylulokinase [Bacteroidetes bacterium SB0662_bin_6]
MSYFVGIDVSTTATKALVIDEQGTVIQTASTEYAFDTPHPQWSEQAPSLWWHGATESIRKALAGADIPGKEVTAIGLTGQMHGLVLLDVAGRVLRPAILWNDQRTSAECDEIIERVGRTELIARTGNDALTGFTAPKILWVRRHEPAIFEKIRQVLLPKDYVRFRLTGEYATDRAGAAGTLLLDVRKRDWSDEVLARLDIPSQWLPPTHEGPDITGTLSAEAAEATGLAVGTPVVAGGGDQSAQAVGVGAVQEGIVALTLGTSGVVFASVNKPFIDPDGRLHSFCHAAPDTWHLMGVMLSAAGSLRWYRDTLFPNTSWDDLLDPARDVQPGAQGLLFLPYLTGERTPHADPMARGAFVGLTVRHESKHMTRSVLEGVAFGLRDSFEIMRSAGLTSIDQVRISGGGARSALWRNILADVLETELVTVNTTEGAAFGAALLAGTGVGAWRDVHEACSATIHVTGNTPKNPETAARYRPFYRAYCDLYPALHASFRTIGGS